MTLSSHGISQRGWSVESRLDWSCANADWNRRYTTRFWRIDRLPPVPMIPFDCRQFDVDPYGLYGYVRTYVDNPELRVELGTEAALARARYLQPTR